MPVAWEPTEQEIEEKLIELAYVWGDIEECLALDGHEWHKTKEHRSRDAERDRWFAARKIQTLRWTGSQSSPIRRDAFRSC